jgi:hypothetical protein
MRINSGIWVKAYLRRCQSGGASAFVMRRGDDVRGAIYIKVSRLDGTAALYGPAPSGFGAGESSASGERQWIRNHKEECKGDRDLDDELARHVEFDGDIWIIEIEERTGRHYLDDWLAKPQAL